MKRSGGGGGGVLDIYDKGEMISCRMSYNSIKIFLILDAFWFQTFFFQYYYCLRGHPFMTPTKNGQQMTLPLPPLAKNYTWQILKKTLYTPILCRYHKCMFPFCHFKVCSVTCLNGNEILDFMKIKSSYLLSSYQRNQVSLYFQLYQLFFEQHFGKFLSVTVIYVCYSRQNFVFKCNCWK